MSVHVAHTFAGMPRALIPRVTSLSSHFTRTSSLSTLQRTARSRPALQLANRSSPSFAGVRRYATETSRAIVATEPGAEHTPGSNWVMEDVRVPTELKDGDVLVEMVASGICHTDITFTNPGMGQTFPIIAGHEGSGIVKAVGPNVTKPIKPGDPVLLSFDSCNACPECHSHRPAYCNSFAPMNLFGERDVFQSVQGDSGIGGKYFGHSSFAKLSVVKETTILPASNLIQNEEELKLFAPLGCGIQTGAGAILNQIKPGPKDRVLVCGLGGVGLSAIMGARIAGCEQIVAVDRVQGRIDLAKDTFGATHGLNTTGIEDFLSAIKEVTNGLGPTVVIETTGFPPLLEAAYYSVANRGSHCQIAGAPDPAYRFNLELVQHIFRGVKLFGCVEGDSYPGDFIPELIKYYRQGRLPVDKMVKYYKAEDFKTALHDMHTGHTIKPVLVW